MIMRKTTKILLGLVLIGIVNPITANASSYWSKVNNNWTYIENGVKKTGWIKDNSKWYYLDSNGNMKTGWLLDNGKWYYLNNDGSMACSTTIDGYTLDSNGIWNNTQAEELSSPIFIGMDLMDKFESTEMQYVGEAFGRHSLRYSPYCSVKEDGAWRQAAIDLQISDMSILDENNKQDIRILRLIDDSDTNNKLKDLLKIIDSENADFIYNKSIEIYNNSTGNDGETKLIIGKRDVIIERVANQISIRFSPIRYK